MNVASSKRQLRTAWIEEADIDAGDPLQLRDGRRRAQTILDTHDDDTLGA